MPPRPLQLLRSPLSRQRMGSAAALLELLTLPVAALGPPGVPFVASMGGLTGGCRLGWPVPRACPMSKGQATIACPRGEAACLCTMACPIVARATKPAFNAHSSCHPTLMSHPGEAQSEAVCRATLSFLAVCVALAPTLVSTLLWRPLPASCDAGAAPAKGLPRLLQRASAAAAACDSRLHRLLCGSARSGRPRALLLCLLGSGYLWVLCKRLAGLS